MLHALLRKLLRGIFTLLGLPFLVALVICFQSIGIQPNSILSTPSPFFLSNLPGMVVQAYNHPTIGRLRQKNHHEFEASQDYGVRHYLKVIIIIKRKSPILSNLMLAINLEQPLLRTWTIQQPLSNFKLSNAHFQLRLPQTLNINPVPAPFSVVSHETSSFCFCPFL